MSNSLYYLRYNSYNVSSDNLLLDQLFITKLIFFFILITFLLDIASILYGEILVWELKDLGILIANTTGQGIKIFTLS